MDPALHAAAAELELLSGLLAAPTGLDLDEWQALLAPLPAVEARVVVLYVLHGMTHEQIGERLGVTMQRVQQRRKSAFARLGRSPLAARLRDTLLC